MALLLAVSLSIDALGIGISYGLRNIKTPWYAKLIISIVSFLLTLLAFSFGTAVSNFIPENYSKWIGAIMLVALGFYIIFSSFLSKPESFDSDRSNHIDLRESFFLGIALSVDSLGTGVCSAVMGLDSLLIPLMVGVFQLLFLWFGTAAGQKLHGISNLPHNVFTVCSGVILIFIALFRLFG